MSQAEAWLTGEYPNQKLHLKLPPGSRGPVGPQGPAGPVGPQGPAGTASDSDIASVLADPGSESAELLSATYVRFEDEAGNPLPTRNVVIKVDSTSGEILDIVSEV